MTGLVDLGQESEFTCVVKDALQEEANLTYGGEKKKTTPMLQEVETNWEGA